MKRFKIPCKCKELVIHLYNRANIGFSALRQHLCKCIWCNEKHSHSHSIPETWQQAELCQPLGLTSLRIEKGGSESQNGNSLWKGREGDRVIDCRRDYKYTELSEPTMGVLGQSTLFLPALNFLSYNGRTSINICPWLCFYICGSISVFVSNYYAFVDKCIPIYLLLCPLFFDLY